MTGGVQKLVVDADVCDILSRARSRGPRRSGSTSRRTRTILWAAGPTSTSATSGSPPYQARGTYKVTSSVIGGTILAKGPGRARSPLGTPYSVRQGAHNLGNITPAVLRCVQAPRDSARDSRPESAIGSAGELPRRIRQSRRLERRFLSFQGRPPASRWPGRRPERTILGGQGGRQAPTSSRRQPVGLPPRARVSGTSS